MHYSEIKAKENAGLQIPDVRLFSSVDTEV